MLNYHNDTITNLLVLMLSTLIAYVSQRTFAKSNESLMNKLSGETYACQICNLTKFTQLSIVNYYN